MEDNFAFDAMTQAAESMANNLTEDPDKRAMITDHFRALWTKPKTVFSEEANEASKRFLCVLEGPQRRTVDLKLLASHAVMTEVSDDAVTVTGLGFNVTLKGNGIGIIYEKYVELLYGLKPQRANAENPQPVSDNSEEPQQKRNE